MTCIVGLVENGTVYMGGDSAGVAGFDLTVRADEKVFRNGDYLMGFTSSFRMGQLLRYAFEPPEIKDGEEINKFMATRFVDAVRQCLKDGGYARKKDEEEIGGTFLVGYKGWLFKIQDDYQVAVSFFRFDVVGCGESYAKGALFAMNQEYPPEQQVRLALEAAEQFSAGVRRPFTILSLRGCD